MGENFKKGIRHGIPIALGYLSVSFSFGIMGARGGLSVLQTVLISMTNVTSAGQLAGLELMLASAPLYEMALTQLIINLRYALMSLSLSQKLDKSMTTLHRMVFAFCNTDEVFAVASGQSGDVGKSYLYGLILTPYFGWAIGTALGAAAGSLLPAIVRDALGVAIYGMFIAIVIPPSRKNKAVLTAVVLAGVLSCLFYYLPRLFSFLPEISSGFTIIICAVAVSAFCAWKFPIETEESGS